MSAHRFKALGPLPYSIGGPDPTTGGSFNTVQLSLGKMIEWYWRVKKWTLDTDFQSSGGGSTAKFLNTDYLCTAGATNERDLAFPSTTYGFGLSDDSSGANASSSGSLLVFGGYRRISSTEYRPRLVIEGVLGAGDGLPVPLEAAALSFSTNEDFFGAGPTPWVDGLIHDEPVKIFYAEGFEGGGFNIHTKFILTPVEWWPYAAANGSPIYDTSDGTQLQSPLN